jgi:adenine-specific DNA-methyltransferase
MNNYEQLKDVLNDIFELNKADLDFGIYRIINQKRKQVNEFIERQLPDDIKLALSETQSADKTEIENELKALKKTLDDVGVVAEDNPKYKSLKERLAGLENSEVLEQEVFSHLANFFKRYYKDGDFISMRRYKKDVYAIPYEGEEVKLHWANHDQYYIKSSENFKNYSFKTSDGKTVTFQLKEVSTEQNNNKTQGDAERKFAIYKEQPVELVEGNLYLNFIYEPFSKTTKQETLLSEAIELMVEQVPAEYASVFTLNPTEKNSKRTLLEKHLNDYVSKNSFDYFIHKDLGGFLSRELDFYIKNEVLYLDDINTKQGDFFLAQLSKVKAIKVVAGKIITFLAQIEDFQKKLWLKKKFVIRTDYCITLDKIPNTYYPEILQNKAQLGEWKTLFDVDIQNAEQLVFEQFLVLDTKFFDEEFKDRLLTEFDDLEEKTNGLLINSDNFQALNLLLEKYQEKVSQTYVDPPYNTSASEIAYKNSFKHSSWLSLISDRIALNKLLMNEKGFFNITIDYAELLNLGKLTDDCFGYDNRTGFVSILINPKGRQHERFFTSSIEYMLTYAMNENNAQFNLTTIDEEKTLTFTEKDEIGKFRYDEFARIRTSTLRKVKPNFYYPIYVSPDLAEVTSEEKEGYTPIYPISNGIEYSWKVKKDSFDENNKTGVYNAKLEKNGEIKIYNKFYEQQVFKNIWTDKKYFAEFQGTNLLKDILGDSLFSYPKSIFAVLDTLKIMSKKDSLILDYFGGSGTTGHATIKLNREDSGNRKYIIVEMGTYFNSVTKPRIQKVIYSDSWKNGKSQDKGGISQIVKYQILESYEDTLNNLYLENKTELDFTGKAKEEYILQYMLELESREHLFNLQMFRKPFDYQLKVTENNELKPTKVDLVETFNYLIGLYVSKVQRIKDIKVVEGTTRTGVKTLVIWRDMDAATHDEVEKLLRRFYDSQRTKEFQQIYINGDHHLENLRTEGDSFKIKSIEETFFKKMFNETDL